MTHSAILTACGLTFAIGNRRLVNAVDLAIAPGELVVVVGPNGAGKTSLFKLLTGELATQAGEIRYDGQLLAQWPIWRLAAKRAVMSQVQRVAFAFRVFEIVRVGIDGIGRKLDRLDRQGLIEAALAAADIGHLAEADYGTLSGGEQQRVQFARVLAQLWAGRSIEARQVLFLDEPVSSLDLCHQLALMDQAARLARQGLAVIAILHDLNLAIRYADRILVLSDGRLVGAGSPAAVLTDDLVSRVFRVDLALGTPPPSGTPFLLPQLHRVAG